MSDRSARSDDRATRPFADFLLEHNRGRGHRLAGEALQDVVAAVLETGKKGTVTLTVSVEPVKNNDEVLQTLVSVVAKAPQLPEKAAMFYADGDGNLRKDDPKQGVFEPLAEVERPAVRDGAEASDTTVHTAPVTAVR